MSNVASQPAVAVRPGRQASLAPAAERQTRYAKLVDKPKSSMRLHEHVVTVCEWRM